MLWFLSGCLYASWPDAETVFPWVFTPQENLEAYELVRWETETWTPQDDPVSAALYLQKAIQHRPGSPLEEAIHFGLMRPRIPPLRSDSLVLNFVGDVMWVEDNHADYTAPVHHLLDGDARIGNLETPTSPWHPTGLSELRRIDPLLFNAPPEQLDGLPLDILQVNNNHSLDMGDVGLAATLLEIEERGRLHTGANQHLLVQIGSEVVAFLSFTWGLNQREVHSNYELFVVPFGHVGETIDLSSIAAQAQAAREAGATQTVVLVHWGFEYEYYPDPHFLQLGRQLVALGADVVVGHGSHTAQPAEICTVNLPEHRPGVGRCSVRTPDGEPRLAAIFYGLGNFGTSTLPTVQLQTGIIGSVSLGPAGVTGMGWSAVTHRTDSAGNEILVPLSDQLDDPVYAEESARLDQHLGAGWRRVF